MTGKMEKMKTRIATLSMHTPPRDIIAATSGHLARCCSL
jgi:hypothetical protein